MAEKEIKDAPIPNAVDAEAIRERLKNDHNISQFSKLGKALLEQSEQPNIITYAQFEPFLPLFQGIDYERLKPGVDEAYRTYIARLLRDYRVNLGINLYQPTIVVDRLEEPRRELYFLDRAFTRFNSDAVEGRSMRDSVPGAVARASSATRDQMLLEASVLDVMEANNTPEQKAYFARVKMESALINKYFFENNLSPEKKAEILGGQETPQNGESPPGGSTIDFIIDDDD